MDIYKDSQIGKWMTERLLNRNEAYEKQEGKTIVTIEQKIHKLYEAIFVAEYTYGNYHTMIGDYEFNANSKDLVKSVESMLSVYADFQI